MEGGIGQGAFAYFWPCAVCIYSTSTINVDVAEWCEFQLKKIMGFFWVLPLKPAVQSPVNALMAANSCVIAIRLKDCMNNK